MLEDTLTPSIDMSLTRYFHLMSSGKHIIMGDVYPQVVRAESTIAYYDTTFGAAAWRYAASPIVDQVIDGLGEEALDYDHDGDSYFDFMFIYYRQVKSTLGEYYVNDGGNQGGYSDLFSPVGVKTYIIDGDTLRVDSEAGAVLTSFTRSLVGVPIAHDRSLVGTVRTAVHEYFHDLTGLVPGHPIHNDGFGAYTVMNASTKGAIIDAWSRHQLDWFDEPLVTIDSDTTIVLGDVIRDGADGAVIVATADTTQFFVVEVRDSSVSKHFDPSGPQGCRQHPQYSGLLIGHVRIGGQEQWGSTGYWPPFMDVEEAKGMFASDGSPDPVLGSDLNQSTQIPWFPPSGGFASNATDLFRDDMLTSTVFGPFTNPSSNLYREPDGGPIPADQSRYSGIHIYNVHWKNPATKDSMVVSFHFEGTTPPTGADVLPEDAHWRGLVQVMGDVQVPDGHVLTVDEGTFVVAAADQDAFAAGRDTTSAEILIEGESQIHGSSGDPVVFTSSRDDDFLHFEGPGEDTAADEGDWYGVRFNLSGCEHASYGYAVGTRPHSEIEHAEFKFASRGISIESPIAPSISHPTFEEITGKRHVYLDSTDVFIPYGFWAAGSSCAIQDSVVAVPGEWRLDGETRVVAANASNVDATFGTPDKVDLVANGNLFTNGASGDTVHFEPETPTTPSTSGAGRDWGGIIMTSESSGSAVRFAKIGYAANPLYLNYPGGTTIKRSRIHTFADLGIWVAGSLPTASSIDSCVVERGSGLHASLGEVGIYLDQSDQFWLMNTTVDLAGRDHEDGGVGVSIWYGRTFCEASPPYPTRDLLVSNCTVLGPGVVTEEDGTYTGLRTNWVCGSEDRDIDVFDSTIENWRYAGVELIQTADIQFKCNTIDEVNRGVDVFRDSEPTGSQMRFRENRIRAPRSSLNFYCVRTNNNQRVKLGPDVTSLYGHNVITANKDSTMLIVEIDTDTTKVVNAEDNLWFVTTATADSNLTVGAWIANRLGASPKSSIDVDPFYVLADEVAVCGEVIGGSAHSSSGETVMSDSDESPIRDGLPQPAIFEFRAIGSNPSPFGAEFELAVPNGKTGEYVLEFFDIQGRRLSLLRESILVPSRTVLRWNGFEESGKRAAPGIYFARLSGPTGVLETRKITFLRRGN